MAIREQLGKKHGDAVHVTVERDTGERKVTVASDIREALRAAGLLAGFDRLAYSHQREYLLWIEQAKKPETRQRRITQMCARLRQRPGR
jgi:uncharacterized protein YdeI (YjbR/CyaY-like superfamily)